jgi:hypothetical protein
MNIGIRKQEANRIAKENAAILKRIIYQKPIVSFSKLDRDHKASMMKRHRKQHCIVSSSGCDSCRRGVFSHDFHETRGGTWRHLARQPSIRTHPTCTTNSVRTYELLFSAEIYCSLYCVLCRLASDQSRANLP